MLMVIMIIITVIDGMVGRRSEQCRSDDQSPAVASSSLDTLLLRMGITY